MFWEDEQGLASAQTGTRRDIPVNKKGWQFVERVELQGDIEFP
jgi:hypothetical protein